MSIAGWAVQKLVNTSSALVPDGSAPPPMGQQPYVPSTSPSDLLPERRSMSVGSRLEVAPDDVGTDGWDDDGWDKEDDDDSSYFDAVSGGKGGHKGAPAAGASSLQTSSRISMSLTNTMTSAATADGWGGDWDLGLDGSGSGSGKVSASSTRLGLKTASSRPDSGDGGLVMRTSEHVKQPVTAAPLSADDLFSMLDGPKTGGSASLGSSTSSSVTAGGVATSGAYGGATTIKPTQSEKTEEFRKRQAERKKGRLQAKKMQVKDEGGGWDDF